MKHLVYNKPGPCGLGSGLAAAWRVRLEGGPHDLGLCCVSCARYPGTPFHIT